MMVALISEKLIICALVPKRRSPVAEALCSTATVAVLT
jgi:hypothetical protein